MLRNERGAQCRSGHKALRRRGSHCVEEAVDDDDDDDDGTGIFRGKLTRSLTSAEVS